MRKLLKYIAALLVVLFVAAAVYLVPTIWFKPWSIDHFYARVFLRFVLKHPMLLSQLRILEPYGLDYHSDDLDDVSIAFQEEEARRVRGEFDVLRSYDFDRLSAERRLSAEVLDWFLANAVEGQRFMFHSYPLNQMFGAQSQLPDFMLNVHQINGPKDARNYVARISKFDVYFGQIQEGLELREKRGIIPPRFVIERVLHEMTEFISPAPTDHLLYTHLHSKLGEIDGVEEEERDALLLRMADEIEQTVYPAYRDLIETLRRQESKATTDDGVWKLPEGEAYYDYLLRAATSTDLSAEKVHELGLQEVSRLRQDMVTLLEVEGYETENLPQVFETLNKEERFLYPATDQGCEQILADYSSILDDIDAKLGPFFDLRPGSTLEVDRIPEFKEKTSPIAYYQPPPMDGSRPGTFFVNLRDTHEHLKFRMRTLAYHEGIPGHHFQIAIAQELTELPFFRRVIPFTAYVEGWALYTETFAEEQGFQPTPFDRLGYLIDQMLRAVRLVVDTGIHHARWTREEAIAYMLEQTGMPESEVVSEVERYIVMPAQACAYMVGQLEILELRRKAEQELGDRFELAQFHNIVLGNGALPLKLLERLVDEWIVRQKST